MPDAVAPASIAHRAPAYAASAPRDRNVSISLPVRFEIDPSTYRSRGVDGAVVDARIADAGGTVTVNRPPPAAVILPIRGMVAVLAVVLLVLHRLRRLFRRPVEGRPFVDENTRSGVSSARLSSDEISFTRRSRRDFPWCSPASRC
jgi:hypothetical protein